MLHEKCKITYCFYAGFNVKVVKDVECPRVYCRSLEYVRCIGSSKTQQTRLFNVYSF